MTQNNDLLSSELNKWTKSMLVDYIVAQTLPAGVKLSDDLSKFLKDSSSDPVSPSHGNSINIANILQSVVVELKSVALSNAKLHDKLNHLNAAPNAQTPKSNAQLFKRPVDVHPNSVTGNRSTLLMLTFVDDLPSIDRSTTDIDSATCALYDALHYCVTSFVPLVVFKPSKFPSWFSKNLKNIVLAKKEMHAKYKASRNPADYNKFSNLCAQYKYYYKKCYKTFLDNTENKLKVNPRFFWDFVRKRRSSNGIPNSVHLNDLTATGPESISSLFSSYFNSVYVPSPASSLPVIPFAQHTLPSDCIFNVDDVENGLATLKNVHSVGPDGLSGTFLYNIRSVLCFPLSLLFRRSIDDGIFPSMLKISSVTPVFKSGDKSNVTNYRPISILSHIAKPFEHLVLQSIQPSVDFVLVDEQYGFRSGRSSTANLIVFNNFVIEAFENRSQVDVVYTDFVKAFERVDHAILIDILYKSGFGEPILSWYNHTCLIVSSGLKCFDQNLLSSLFHLVFPKVVTCLPCFFRYL
ncbi:hypothetical protein QTP88_019668 [Uroleucon formosanum]